MSLEILLKALELAADEIPVFPCAHNKRPTCPHGFKAATCEPEAIRTLWCDHPGPLIGVPTGKASGIFVVDVDSAKHVEADQWLERHAAYLPETREHRTQSGGLHLLFKHQDGLKNTASKIARGIDTRGEGGYTVWWPAAVAQSADRKPPLADLPEWIAGVINPPEPAYFTPQPIQPPDDAGARKKIEGIVRVVASARIGERNSLVHWGACRFAELAAQSVLSSQTAHNLALEAARRTGLPYREALRTVQSAFRSGRNAA